MPETFFNLAAGRVLKTPSFPNSLASTAGGPESLKTSIPSVPRGTQKNGPSRRLPRAHPLGPALGNNGERKRDIESARQTATDRPTDISQTQDRHTTDTLL